MHRRRTLNASKIEASAGFLLLSPSYGESGRREEPCNTSAALGYPRGVMPVHVVQHPLVEDVLARLRDKTTPSEEFRQLSPTGWRCSSWLKPPATCPCRTSRPDGGHGRVGGHGDRARRRTGGQGGKHGDRRRSRTQG